MSLSKPKQCFAKRVQVKKRYEIPGCHAARIPCEVRDERIKKGQTYALEPNEILASDLELEISPLLAEAKEDGVLFMRAEIGNPSPQKIRLLDVSVGEIVEAESLTEEQTTDIIAKNLQHLPEEQVEALT